MVVFGGYENETADDRGAATATTGKKKQQPTVSYFEPSSRPSSRPS